MARDRSAIACATLVSVLLHGVALVVPLRGGRDETASATARILRVALPSLAPVLPNIVHDETLPGLAPDEVIVEPAETNEIPAQGSAEMGISVQKPAVLAPPEKVYRIGVELHQRPIPLLRIDLKDLGREFPGASGRFTVRISELGLVDDVRIEEGSTPALARVYQAWLRTLRFVPGKISGHAVASELVIEIHLPTDFLPMPASAD